MIMRITDRRKLVLVSALLSLGAVSCGQTDGLSVKGTDKAAKELSPQTGSVVQAVVQPQPQQQLQPTAQSQPVAQPEPPPPSAAEVISSGLDADVVPLEQMTGAEASQIIETIPEIVTETPATWWQPKASDNLTWQWQLQGKIDTSFPVQVYNIDIEVPQETIDELRDRGVKLICYFSAGTVESFRDDADLFPAAIIGEQYEDLIDERWVDYAQIDVLAQVMRARLDKCQSKGFHAVEIDNVDAHNYETRNENGDVVNIGTNFNMTLDESIAYVLWLTEEAHSRGLGIGLKNAEEMVPDVVNEVDWMLVEDCYFDSWCMAATAFIDADKPVFMAEYDDLVPDFTPACELAKALGFSAIWRDPGLATRLYLACE